MLGMRMRGPVGRHRLVWALLGGSLLLLQATQAAADFTPEEKKSLLHVRSANRALSSGIQDYVNPHRLEQGIKPIMLTAAKVSREVTLELGLLLNVITEQHGTPLFDELAAKTRDERVKLAWWHGDRAVTGMRTLQQMLQEAEDDLVDPVIKDHLARARTIWIENAITQLGMVDRSLAYATPNFSTFPQVVGPHGDYEGFMWLAWRSQHYAHDAMDIEMGTSLRMHSAKNILVDAMLLIADVTWTTSQASKSRFFRVLDVIEMLTSSDIQFSAPPRFQQALNLVKLEAAKNKIADSWKHSDDAVWRLMIFLDCSKLHHPEGCGGR